MSVVSLLQEIINENVVIRLNQNRKSVDLSGNETTFTIGNLPEDSIAIKADSLVAVILAVKRCHYCADTPPCAHARRLRDQLSMA